MDLSPGHPSGRDSGSSYLDFLNIKRDDSHTRIEGSSSNGNKSSNTEACCGGTGNGFTDALAFQEAMNPVTRNQKMSRSKSFVSNFGRLFGFASLGLSINAKSIAYTHTIKHSRIGVNLLAGSEIFSAGLKSYSKVRLEILGRISSTLRIFGRTALGVSVTYDFFRFRNNEISGGQFFSSTYYSSFALMGPFGFIPGLSNYVMGDLLGGYERGARMSKEIRAKGGLTNHLKSLKGGNRDKKFRNPKFNP